jgi:flagellar motor switch protein FliM
MLSQNEVDALLAALKDSREREPSETGPEERAEEPADVRAYDFGGSIGMPLAESAALSDLYELAARGIGAGLSGAAGTAVECRLDSLERATWAEFVMALAGPTCFAAVALEGAPASRSLGEGGRASQLAFEMSPAALYPVMERLLGAPPSAEADVPSRPFTAIERRIAAAVVEMAMAAVEEVWRRSRPRLSGLRLRLAALESNPRIAPLAPAGEEGCLAALEIAIAPGGRADATRPEPPEAGGKAHLWIPRGSCTDLAGETGSDPALSRGSSAAAAAALASVPVKVEAVAFRTRMTLRELGRLSAGDLIRPGVEAAAGRGAGLAICGVEKLRGAEEVSRGRRAVRIGAPPGPGAPKKKRSRTTRTGTTTRTGRTSRATRSARSRGPEEEKG